MLDTNDSTTDTTRTQSLMTSKHFFLLNFTFHSLYLRTFLTDFTDCLRIFIVRFNDRATGMVVVRPSVCPSVCHGCIVAKLKSVEKNFLHE